MFKANSDLRMEAKGRGVPLWAIADRLNYCEQTLIRKWRYELPEQDKLQIRQIIAELSAKDRVS